MPSVLPHSRFSRTLKSMESTFLALDVETLLQQLAAANGKDAEQPVKDTVARMLAGIRPASSPACEGASSKLIKDCRATKDVRNRIDRLLRPPHSFGGQPKRPTNLKRLLNASSKTTQARVGMSLRRLSNGLNDWGPSPALAIPEAPGTRELVCLPVRRCGLFHFGKGVRRNPVHLALGRKTGAEKLAAFRRGYSLTISDFYRADIYYVRREISNRSAIAHQGRTAVTTFARYR